MSCFSTRWNIYVFYISDKDCLFSEFLLFSFLTSIVYETIDSTRYKTCHIKNVLGACNCLLKVGGSFCCFPFFMIFFRGTLDLVLFINSCSIGKRNIYLIISCSFMFLPEGQNWGSFKAGRAISREASFFTLSRVAPFYSIWSRYIQVLQSGNVNTLKMGQDQWTLVKWHTMYNYTFQEVNFINVIIESWDIILVFM